MVLYPLVYSFLLGLSKHYKKQVNRLFHAQCPQRYLHKIQMRGVKVNWVHRLLTTI